MRRPSAMAALLAAVLSCNSAAREGELYPPSRALTAEVDARWSLPPGEHVFTVRERDDSVVIVVRVSGRITVLNPDLSERSEAAAPVMATGGPVSAATICSDGVVVVVGGLPRSLGRLERRAARATSVLFPPALGDVHALSCATADDVLMLVDPVPMNVEHPSLLRTNALIVRWRAPDRLDTLATLAGHEFLLHGGSRGWSPPPFAGELHAAVGTTVLYAGITDEPTIRVVQTNGRTVGSIAYIAQGTPIPRATVDSALRNQLRPFITDFSTPDYVVMVDSLSVGRETPPWSALAVDADDNLWIGTNEDAGAGAATRQWRIFAVDGSPVGRLQLPSDFHITHVTDAGVLGRWRAADGGEEVRRYRVRGSALAARGGR